MGRLIVKQPKREFFVPLGQPARGIGQMDSQDALNLADLALLDFFSQSFQRPGELEVMAHRENPFFALRDRDKLPAFLYVHRHGFFQQDVLAHFEHRSCERVVALRRGSYDHCVHVFHPTCVSILTRRPMFQP